MPKFSQSELQILNITTKMFTEPVLELDMLLLEQHLEEVRDRKTQLLEAANANKEVLMSNDKFAELLTSLGVEPPMKVSARTGKDTWAFAKSDEEFKELANHEDERVQALVAARLGTKSTLEETRTERFINIAKRGSLPVPLRYYAAHTGRWGGDDKLNLQNLPSRGTNTLKNAIIAPDGYVVIDADSSQIEARVLAWLSGQNDLVEFFRKNNEEIASGVAKDQMQYDPYKIMASQIYNKPVDQVTKQERFVGKTTILGSGYGMGSEKFQTQLKGFGTDLPINECVRIIDVYRRTYPMIPNLWRQAGKCLDAMLRGASSTIGVQPQALYLDPASGFVLPNGLFLSYTNLQKSGTEYVYKSRKGYTRIYGGKVVENLCQALARCIIGEQMVKMNLRYKVVLTVHDAVACIAKESEAQEAQQYIEACMKWTPDWATGLPLSCESGFGKRYGDC